MNDQLKEFGKIINHMISRVDHSIAVEREAEVEQVLKQFTIARRPSFLLVGPAGCGKTSIFLEAVRRLNSVGKKRWTVLQTSTSDLLRNTRYIGEWQTRVINFAETAKRKSNVVAFCTDITNLPATGKWSKSDENMALALKPYLEDGRVFLVGECDEQQFAKNIQTNPWFENCFTIIRIEASTDEQCRKIVDAVFRRSLRALQSSFPASESISCDSDTIDALFDYGKIFFSSLAAPAGALKLAEEICKSFTKQLEESSPSFEAFVDKDWNCDRGDVVAAVSALTGLPTLLFDDREKLDLRQTREYFETRVIGQTRAIHTIVNLITLIKAGLNDPRKPLGVLFFVGPTGVGKTELAKKLAEFIFGSADRLLRLDMSEYKDYHAFEKLIGDSNPNENRPAAGHLLESIRNQPFQVILMDEIEKAHANIFDILLQLFDDGRLTDARGNTVDFTQTIIILTSNLGSNLDTKNPIGFSEAAEREDDEAIQKAMRKVFRPELINRIDHIVPFRALEKEHVRLIAQRELGQVLLRSGITRRQLQIDVQPGVIDILAAQGFHPLYGARPLKRGGRKTCSDADRSQDC